MNAHEQARSRSDTAQPASAGSPAAPQPRNGSASPAEPDDARTQESATWHDALREHADVGAAGSDEEAVAPGTSGLQDGRESQEWQDELRRHADDRSSGSDESAVNAMEPAAGSPTRLSGGLVR